MAGFGLTVLGLNAAIIKLARLQGKVDDAMLKGVRRGCLRGVGIVQGNMAGRPGPRRRSGDLIRSIESDAVRIGPNEVHGQIGTNAPQARRLEYGFTGYDSLDRYYDQPPYPFLRPSVPAVTAVLEHEVGIRVKKVVDKWQS